MELRIWCQVSLILLFILNDWVGGIVKTLICWLPTISCFVFPNNLLVVCSTWGVRKVNIFFQLNKIYTKISGVRVTAFSETFSHLEFFNIF